MTIRLFLADGVQGDSVSFVLKMLCQSNPGVIFFPLVVIDLFVVAVPVWVLERAVVHGTINSIQVRNGSIAFVFVVVLWIFMASHRCTNRP